MKNKIKSLVYQLLTVLVGNTLVFFQPEKAKQLSENGMTLVLDNRMSIMERLMRSAILNKLEKRKDFDTLAKLHQNYWANKGDDFFLETEAAFQNDFLPNCSFIFDELEKELINSPAKFHALVEIGTGNGSVLNYLCSKFPNIDRFVGIDLSPVQVQINNKKYNENKKLEFVASDGFDWVKAHGQSHTIFVTSRGVLEYFTEQRLQAFLKEIHLLGDTIFIAIEPKGIEHNYETNPNSQPYGHERSFSHNYPKLFKNAGFSLWHLSFKPLNQSTIQGFIGARN